MTIWLPDLQGLNGPRYLAIAEAVKRDITQGRLQPGDRLPPHRDLAYRLGVTVGTVTRAYREAERRGFLIGEVGRGTFVRTTTGAPSVLSQMGVPDRQVPHLIDLSRNEPPRNDESVKALQRELAALAAESNLHDLLAYQPAGGMPHHRDAGARWMQRRIPATDPADVVITAGGQHALTVALMAFCRAGDVVLTEELTYPGMRGLAAMLGVRLQGLAMDQDGLRPDALEAACRSGARLLYVMPCHQNPTAVTMPEQRRRDIAAVVRRHGLLLLEDDIYGVLSAEELPAVTTLAPETSCYLIGTKMLGPGLRIGFLRVPPSCMPAVESALRATIWMAPPLTAEIATRWIEDGTLDQLIAWHWAEAEKRGALLQEHLGPAAARITQGGYLAWLELPEPWHAGDFARQARAAGVSVLPADTFAAGRSPPAQAVRLGLGAPADHGQLVAGLSILARLLREKPRMDAAVG
jgi:DNA-binding transcriptional MocR family regulator